MPREQTKEDLLRIVARIKVSNNELQRLLKGYEIDPTGSFFHFKGRPDIQMPYYVKREAKVKEDEIKHALSRSPWNTVAEALKYESENKI